MRKRFAKRLALRRVVALAAAYAIALSGLITSFNAVRIAVAEANYSNVIICERAQLGNPTPGSDLGDLGKSAVSAASSSWPRYRRRRTHQPRSSNPLASC